MNNVCKLVGNILFISVFIALSYNFHLNGNFIVILLLTIILYSFGNRLYNFKHNPLTIFLIGWMVPLIISQLNLSSLQVPYSTKTKLLIGISTTQYLIITFLFAIALNKRNINKRNIKINVEKLYKPIIILLVINIIGYILNWIIVGGIPFIVGENVVSHLTFARFTSYLTGSYIVTCTLPILYLVLGGKKHKIIMFFAIAFPYIISILQMARGFITVAFFYQISFLYLALFIKGVNFKKYNKRIILLIIISIIFTAIIGNLLGTKRAKDSSGTYKLSNYYWSEVIGLKYRNETLAYAYSYYAMGFDQLNYLLNNYNGPYLDGYDLLYPVIGPTQLKNHWYINRDYVYKNIPTIWGEAVGTYLQSLYIDGGLLYTIIISAVLAFVVNFLYFKAFISGNNINLKMFCAYLIFSYGVFYMFFGQRFFDIFIYINIFIYIYVIKHYIKFIR
jgi:oligosaccharide repeat unit polymerase